MHAYLSRNICVCEGEKIPFCWSLLVMIILLFRSLLFPKVYFCLLGSISLKGTCWNIKSRYSRAATGFFSAHSDDDIKFVNSLNITLRGQYIQLDLHSSVKYYYKLICDDKKVILHIGFWSIYKQWWGQGWWLGRKKKRAEKYENTWRLGYFFLS